MNCDLQKKIIPLSRVANICKTPKDDQKKLNRCINKFFSFMVYVQFYSQHCINHSILLSNCLWQGASRSSNFQSICMKAWNHATKESMFKEVLHKLHFLLAPKLFISKWFYNSQNLLPTFKYNSSLWVNEKGNKLGWFNLL